MRTTERLEELRQMLHDGTLPRSSHGAHIEQLINDLIEANRLLDDITVVVVDDDDETWVMGAFVDEETGMRHLRSYVIERFGEEAVAEAEAGENGVADLVSHKFESVRVIR